MNNIEQEIKKVKKELKKACYKYNPHIKIVLLLGQLDVLYEDYIKELESKIERYSEDLQFWMNP